MEAKSAVSQDSLDHIYMSEALLLAKKGLFTTHPNPRVGCVIVKDGVVVGRGWHKKSGEGHAEVHAIRQAGELAKGACAYVTLEPCSHFGKTPPCADALIKAGIARVVAAMVDPNPEVSGRGMARLEAHNIETKTNVLAEEARQLNKGFVRRMLDSRPWVTIKLAMSVDGRTAMASGESQWITSAYARADVQRLRAESSAIMTGVETVLQDDAALTVRKEQLDLQRFSDVFCDSDSLVCDGVSLEEVLARQPLRVVMDSEGRLPLKSRLLSFKGPVLWVVAEGLKFDSEQTQLANLSHVKVLRVNQGSRRESLNQVMNYLAEQGCNELLVEAGSTLSGEIIKSGYCDELVVYMAPKLMGSLARPLFNLPLDTMNQSIDLTLVDMRQFGDDIRFIYRPAGAVLTGSAD